MPLPPHARRGFALALVAAGAFGALPVFGKFAFAEGLSVVTLLAWRFGIAAALLWGLVLARPSASGAGRMRGPRRAALLGLGAVYAVNSGLYFLALRRIPATATSLVFYVYPALVALLEIAFLGRRARPAKLGALALTLAGVALTVGVARGGLDPIGVALALASAVVVSAYLSLGELALAGLPTLPATAHVMLGTALAYAAWHVAAGADLPSGLRAWVLVGTMAVVSTALSILAMLGAIARIGAGATSILITLEVLVTAGLAAALLGETLEPRQYAGGALILSGVVLLRLASRRPAPVVADT